MLNIEKTKWMLKARSKIKGQIPEVKIANNIIEKVSKMKYLGVVIDEKVSFDLTVF